MKDEYLQIILDQVKRVRQKYGFGENAPICDYIFNILKNECILVKWPENGQLDLDGLSTEKVVNGKLETVVFINSAKNMEKQIFCAAHELGHRYKLDQQLKDSFPDDVIFMEDIMNRFAAELLMPASDFKERSGKLYESCKGIRANKKVVFAKKLLEAVVDLMDFYFVPYKAVVLRLQEMKIITERVYQFLQKYGNTEDRKSVVDAIIRENGITRLRIPDRKVQYSVPLENICGILQNPDVTKYMTKNELNKYLQGIGIAKEDAQLLEDMRDIELKTIEM